MLGLLVWAFAASYPDHRTSNADQPVGVGTTVESKPSSVHPRSPSGGLATPTHPNRPTGRAPVAAAAPSQVESERPTRLVLASGTAVPVHVASTDGGGQLVLPSNVRHAGWWDGGARLGDPLGSIVIAAHVDSFTQGLGAFAELLSAHPGQRLRLSSPHLARTYRITIAHLVPKDQVNQSSPLYTGPSQGRLVLITCGGSYDARRGGYQDNFVAIAVPVAPLRHG